MLWKCHRALGSSSTTGYLCDSFSCCSHHSNSFGCLRCLNSRSLWKHLSCGARTRVTSQSLAVCQSGSCGVGQTLIVFLNARAALKKKLHQLSKREKYFPIYLIGSFFTGVTSFAIFCTLKCSNLQPFI